MKPKLFLERGKGRKVVKHLVGGEYIPYPGLPYNVGGLKVVLFDVIVAVIPDIFGVLLVYFGGAAEVFLQFGLRPMV